ncbi:hypothetical protein EB796_003198 [Bugula neritina]|uniref:Potassium channel domain-containing protein n=1 Tax=Bugula neritina TaxID=10212 RepID=A0A7J7KIF1_BUGNE|nr:hypothetical protein EB796_003198 [Bugula neritina]
MEERSSRSQFNQNGGDGKKVPRRNTNSQSAGVDAGIAAIILNRMLKFRNSRINSSENVQGDGEATENTENGEVKIHWIKAVIIHVTLILLLIAYSFIGAAIFKALEENSAEEIEINIVKAKARLLESIWNLNQTDNKELWIDKANEMLSLYDQNISKAISHGIDIGNTSQHFQNLTRTGGPIWDIWNSLFFAGTVYTTIGYGHLSPVTAAGKIATIIYAVIGIPLCFIVLADLGGLFSKLLRYIMKNCRRRCCRRKQKFGEQTEEEEKPLSSSAVMLCLGVICIAYLFIGAGIYSIWEDWDYLDAFYFMFISVSTIGLGDIVPEHPKFFLITFIYIFFGLSLLSTGFTVMQQHIKSTITHASDQLDSRLRHNGSHSSLGEEGRDGIKLLTINCPQINTVEPLNSSSPATSAKST